MTDNPDLVRDLQAVVGETYVMHMPEDLIVFEYDGAVDRPCRRRSWSPDRPRRSPGLSPSRGVTAFPSSPGAREPA